MKTKRVKGADGKSHLELAEGSCVVKIYSGEQKKNGASYPVHYVTHFEGGERVRRGFSDADEAKTHAATVLTRLVNGETAAHDLRPVQLQEAAMALSEAEALGLNLEPGGKVGLDRDMPALCRLGVSGANLDKALFKIHTGPWKTNKLGRPDARESPNRDKGEEFRTVVPQPRQHRS